MEFGVLQAPCRTRAPPGRELRDVHAIFSHLLCHPRKNVTTQAVILHLLQEVLYLPGIYTLLLMTLSHDCVVVFFFLVI